MARTDIRDFQENGRYSGVYILNRKQLKNTKTGNEYLQVELSDSSARISCNLWNSDDFHSLFDSLEEGGFVRADLNASTYNGTMQGTLNSISHANPTVEEMEGLVPRIKEDPALLHADLLHRAENIQDEVCRNISLTILNDFRKWLLVWPAAKSMHHHEIGGLILHMHEMADYAEAIHQVTPCFDMDYVLTGIIAHDIGKIREYTAGKTGLLTDTSTAGRLLAHPYIGAAYVGKLCERFHASKEQSEILQHLVLSHHGDLEKGAVTVPQTTEALILHIVDEASASIRLYSEVSGKTAPGTWSDNTFGIPDNYGGTRGKLYVPACTKKENR